MGILKRQSAAQVDDDLDKGVQAFELSNQHETLIKDLQDNKIDNSEKGENDGVATLDSTGKIPVSQIPVHTHKSSDVTSMAEYTTTGVNAEAITPSDTLNQAIAKLEKKVNGKQDSGKYATGDDNGVALSAEKLTNTSKIGNTNKGVYFDEDGLPKPMTYELNKTVPSNAEFTDTKYTAESNSGISVDANTKKISNTGVRSISESSDDGKIGFNLNGEDKEVQVKGFKDFILKKLETPATSYAAQYQLFSRKDNTGEYTAVADSATIDIPKDLVVESGDVKTCTVANVPVSGYKVGDKYIDLVIANKTDAHIYINVKDLVGISGRLVETVGYEHNNYIAPDAVTYANYEMFSFHEEIKPNLMLAKNGGMANLYTQGELTNAFSVTHCVNSNLTIDSNVEEMHLIADYDVTSDTTADEAIVSMAYTYIDEDGDEALDSLIFPIDLTNKGGTSRAGIKLPEEAIGVEENVVALQVNGTHEFDITLRLNLIKVPKGTEIDYDTYEWREPTWSVASALDSILLYMHNDMPDEIRDRVIANITHTLKDLRDKVDNVIEDVKDFRDEIPNKADKSYTDAELEKKADKTELLSSVSTIYKRYGCKSLWSIDERIMNAAGYIYGSTWNIPAGNYKLCIKSPVAATMQLNLSAGSVTKLTKTFNATVGSNEVSFELAEDITFIQLYTQKPGTYTEIAIIPEDAPAEPYVPYAPTNRELQTNLLSTIVASSNASASNSKTLEFQGTGKTLEKLVIEGKTVQDGTPSPSAPVEVKGVGNRTPNLFDVTAYLNTITGANRGTVSKSSNSITITATADDAYATPATAGDNGFRIAVKPNTSYTVSWSANNNNSGAIYIFYNGNTSTQVNANNSAVKSKSFTTPTNCTFITLRFGVATSGQSITYSNIMVNEGATALPHEPYGLYKIPISVAGKSTNIYLNAPLFDGDTADLAGGVVDKKYVIKVFDGSENWYLNSQDTNEPSTIKRYSCTLSGMKKNAYAFSSHFQSLNAWGWNSSGRQGVTKIESSSVVDFKIFTSVANTVTEWKTWLAEQYAVGTPVTYMTSLATPTKETFDTPEIATVVGKNTLTVGTDVTPSKIEVTSFGEYYSKAEVDKMLADKLNKSYASDITDRITYLTGLYRKNLIDIPSATGNNLVNSKTISLPSGTYVLSYDQTAETGQSSLTLKNGSATTLYQTYSNAKKVKVKFTTAYSNSITIYSAVNTTISNVMIINTANWDEDTPYEPYRLSLQEQIDALKAAIPSATSEE